MSIVRSISIVQLILFAFIAVALPLLWGILTALYRVDRLVEINANAIVKVKQETLASRSLAEHLTSMERSAKQFRVLGDANLQEVYLNNRKHFHILLKDFIESKPDTQRLDLANRLNDNEQHFFTLLQAPPEPSIIDEMETLIAELHSIARTLVSETDNRLVEQTDLLAGEAKTLKQRLLSQAFWVLPITAVLGILFVILITKPIHQLNMAVRELGQGNLHSDVNVGGPHDLQELGVRLNWLRDKLREVEQQKQAFLRNISHELKTPLASIREGAELLTVCGADESVSEQYEIISILKNSSIHLQHLIENLLRFNELTAAASDIQKIDFEKLVNQVITPYQLSLNTKKLSIQKNIEPINIAANYNHIKLVIGNLLSNAIKFSPNEGAIHIVIKEMKGNILMSIADSGPGVPQSDTHKIFDLFYRGPERSLGPLASSGLGLAIVKEIIARLNGKINVINIDPGAQFNVTLPISDNGVLYSGH